MWDKEGKDHLQKQINSKKLKEEGEEDLEPGKEQEMRDDGGMKNEEDDQFDQNYENIKYSMGLANIMNRYNMTTTHDIDKYNNKNISIKTQKKEDKVGAYNETLIFVQKQPKREEVNHTETKKSKKIDWSYLKNIEEMLGPIVDADLQPTEYLQNDVYTEKGENEKTAVKKRIDNKNSNTDCDQHFRYKNSQNEERAFKKKEYQLVASIQPNYTDYLLTNDIFPSKIINRTAPQKNFAKTSYINRDGVGGNSSSVYKSNNKFAATEKMSKKQSKMNSKNTITTKFGKQSVIGGYKKKVQKNTHGDSNLESPDSSGLMDNRMGGRNTYSNVNNEIKNLEKTPPFSGMRHLNSTATGGNLNQSVSGNKVTNWANSQNNQLGIAPNNFLANSTQPNTKHPVWSDSINSNNSVHHNKNSLMITDENNKTMNSNFDLENNNFITPRNKSMGNSKFLKLCSDYNSLGQSNNQNYNNQNALNPGRDSNLNSNNSCGGGIDDHKLYKTVLKRGFDHNANMDKKKTFD